MAGIAGIARVDKRDQVSSMLDELTHRGPAGRKIVEGDGCTLGLVWPSPQAEAATLLEQSHVAQDKAGDGRYASAQAKAGGCVLKRDPLGVAPLYYGQTEGGALCFASEVKALAQVSRDIHELLPGYQYDGRSMQAYFELTRQPPLDLPADQVAHELRRRLDASVSTCVEDGPMGSWLSGGLDSSTMAALASAHVDKLYTFTAGLEGSSDVEFARQVADHLDTDHHVRIVTLEDLLAILPQVIYHLESFDALLVRSSLANYLVAQMASDYVPAVFSGEGGDELFAGYEYLKSLDPAELPDELIDITDRLHNTALQRVDRSASAHGTLAHVGFLDPGVVDYALRIPVEFKLHDGVEKWILRQAVGDVLPEPVLTRTKAKFWEGAGVGDLLACYADEHIDDKAFTRERVLPNGWLLNTKEELMYYRIFREHFQGDLTWMGRTKGAPQVEPAAGA
jgi:asparagine synthase (glutamine-hydrolysing)